jgi:16S rRNA (cytidine1402-2'-O)-methyltransferase
LAELYVVATPIGNLNDITLRALEVLKAVDWIAAEDTRHSQRLLNHFGIKQRLLSLHEFNENKRAAEIIKRVEDGQSVALISDAGTPLISDPGYPLIAKAQAKKIKVVPIPGPCAAISALSVSGLPTHQFVFEGFLPPKGEKRVKRLKMLTDETRTMIFYEARHRIVNLLELLVEVFGGERQACLARELTKTFETIFQATLKEIASFLDNPDQQKGEFVVIVAGIEKREESMVEADKVLTILLAEVSVKQAVKVAQKLTGISRQTLYGRALELK